MKWLGQIALACCVWLVAAALVGYLAGVPIARVMGKECSDDSEEVGKYLNSKCNAHYYCKTVGTCYHIDDFWCEEQNHYYDRVKYNTVEPVGYSYNCQNPQYGSTCYVCSYSACAWGYMYAESVCTNQQCPVYSYVDNSCRM